MRLEEGFYVESNVLISTWATWWNLGSIFTMNNPATVRLRHEKTKDTCRLMEPTLTRTGVAVFLPRES